MSGNLSTADDRMSRHSAANRPTRFVGIGLVPRKYTLKKPHRKLNTPQIEKLLQWHAAGISVAVIAAQLGLSRVHVYRLIDRYCS